MTYLAGLGLGLSLIVAIGAQNLFVLRQGVRKEHVGLVVLICAVSDAALIAAGISGLGAAIAAMPWLVTVTRYAGAAFLLGYAIMAARRAWQPSGATLDAAPNGNAAPAPSAGAGESHGAVATRLASPAAQKVALTAIALTWLNPHVYLDTVFLLGSVAATHADARWIFGLGAMTGSVLWFAALGYGSQLLGRVLAKPSAWRVLDGVIAVIMAALAASLALGA